MMCLEFLISWWKERISIISTDFVVSLGGSEVPAFAPSEVFLFNTAKARSGGTKTEGSFETEAPSTFFGVSSNHHVYN